MALSTLLYGSRGRFQLESTTGTALDNAFQTSLDADLAVFFDADEFARTVVYAPKGGTAVAIKAIFSEEDTDIQSPNAPADSMVLLVKIADVPNPRKGDVVTIDSVAWYVVGSPQGGADEGIWHVRLSRSGRVQL